LLTGLLLGGGPRKDFFFNFFFFYLCLLVWFSTESNRNCNSKASGSIMATGHTEAAKISDGQGNGGASRRSLPVICKKQIANEACCGAARTWPALGNSDPVHGAMSWMKYASAVIWLSRRRRLALTVESASLQGSSIASQGAKD